MIEINDQHSDHRDEGGSAFNEVSLTQMESLLNTSTFLQHQNWKRGQNQPRFQNKYGPSNYQLGRSGQHSVYQRYRQSLGGFNCYNQPFWCHICGKGYTQPSSAIVNSRKVINNSHLTANQNECATFTV